MKAYIRAPAKINLHLEILDKRTDGYHNLISIFQSVSLFDTIVISILDKGKGCTIKGDFPFPHEQNIVKKAVDKFFMIGKQEFNLKIDIQKRIPLGAGLGGGSSDAAAVITCLKTLFPGNTCKEEIRCILTDLGSDVPYFYDTAAGLVQGRGEKIKSLPPRKDYYLLIVFPGFQVNTKKAYSWLDEKREGMSLSRNSGKKGRWDSLTSLNSGSNLKVGKVFDKRYAADDLENMYIHDEPGKWGFFNSFKEVIIEKHPVISTIISDLYSTGAFYGNITGSGSALFGLYKEESKAFAASGSLKNKYPFVFCAKPLDKIPLIVLK